MTVQGPGRVVRAGAVALLGLCALASAGGAGVPAYSPAGSFELPAGTSRFDVMPSGRALAIAGDEFYLQDEFNPSAWGKVGSLPVGTVASYGASFVRVSPDGGRIAVGDNLFGAGASVYTLDYAALDPGAPSGSVRWELGNTEGYWSDTSTLYVSGADGALSAVTRLDVGAGVSRQVVSNIGGASSGVVTDGMWLYAGNAFDYLPGGSETGEVRAVSLASIAGLAPGETVDFELATAPVARALSAASLGFDSLGNLLIGGGDVFGGTNDFGYAAVVDGDAVAAALLGGPVAPDSAELRLTPRTAGDSYSTVFNAATNELLVSYFDNSTFSAGLTVYRYSVPGPGALGVFALAAVARRRRGDA